MTQLCHINEIDDVGSKGFEVGDQTVFAVKKDGELFVYRNRCPHLGIELEWQEHQFLDSDNALIQCATHGALFIIESGECVAGPCQGESLQPIPFTVENDHIVLGELPAVE